jgi:hypothetical protein
MLYGVAGDIRTLSSGASFSFRCNSALEVRTDLDFDRRIWSCPSLCSVQDDSICRGLLETFITPVRANLGIFLCDLREFFATSAVKGFLSLHSEHASSAGVRGTIRQPYAKHAVWPDTR